MRARIAFIWTQFRRLWRPVLALGVVLTAFGACRHWDPVTETVISPAAARTPPQTAQLQSPRPERSLTAR